MKRTALVASACTVSLLAGTACAEDEPADDLTAEDAGQQEDGTGSGEGEAQGEDSVPTFGEIHEEMWDAMLEAETVSLQGRVEADEANLDEIFDELDDDAEGTLHITGATDGSNSEMEFSAGDDYSFTLRSVDGSDYVRGEDFAELLISSLDDDVVEAAGEDTIRGIVEDRWVDLTAEGGAVPSVAELIEDMRDDIDSDDIAEITGELEERDGHEVYVYTDEDGEDEIVVAAEGAPYLLELRLGDDYQFTFSEWNEAETPEAPEDALTDDELIDQVIAEAGW